MIKETDRVAFIRLKNQFGFNFVEIIVILAVLSIFAAIAVPRFFNLSDKASEKFLNAAKAELNGREKLAFSDIKKSQDGWVNDQKVFSKVNTDMGSGFHWSPDAKKDGGTLHYKDQKIKLKRIASTYASAGKWIEED